MIDWTEAQWLGLIAALALLAVGLRRLGRKLAEETSS